MKSSASVVTKRLLNVLCAGALGFGATIFQSAFALNLASSPLYLTTSQSPLILLTMARDHKLYYEAYNDYSDLDGDGTLDVGYKPASIDYYGYFDSYKCYGYASGIFTPVAVTDNKKCTGSNDSYWSGDFLNYVTMSRMDVLRKVFYGGYRSTDTSTQTILERVFIPQDAHSWGKEYQSIARDGYDIREYTPLNLPQAGYRHLFADTTLSSTSTSIMRVLNDSPYRIWEWVSIERPVAGTECATGANVRVNCAHAGSTSWLTVPASTTAGLSSLTRKFYNTSGVASHPADRTAFDTLESTYGIPAKLCGTDNPTTIDSSGNPFAGTNGCDAGSDYYMTILTGTINVPNATTYTFSVDGDDAVDVFVDGTLVASYYGGHAFCNCNTYSGTITLTAGAHTIKFRHEEMIGGDGYKLQWQQSVPASAIADYNVRVEVCKEIAGVDADHNFGREANCQGYGSGTPSYKPTGLLHKYGQNNGMYFGLLTGSYDQNTNGGILRKAIGSFANEVEQTTGIFKESGATCGTDGATTCVKGIVGTINRLKITSYDYASNTYSCGWITTRAMNNGECEMWGNPLAEMMYEGLRYFSGASGPTSSFVTSTTRDDALGLPKYTSTWPTLYSASATPPAGQYPKCAKPYFMLVSDVFPSFDSDSLPGIDSNFGTFSGTSTFNSNPLNVATRGQSLWDMEFGGSAVSKNIFIGQVGNTYDGAPTVKSATSFGNIRGLSPNEPTRQGSYYSASVAYFAHIADINSVDGGQKISTFSIALAPPLPTIQIPIPNTTNKITLVPFAKSVGGMSISATQGSFQPTNQIVDFYVDTIKNTTAGNADATVNSGRPYYKFRINYEDVEQGADHDMDAIATYEVLLNADNTVTVNVNSDYAAGGIIQHMGYVISGTSADGVYLVVRDLDTAAASDPDYFLDQPNTANVALPLTSSRTFSANSSAATGTLLKDPLWYAAKYGGFSDANGNNIPDNATATTVSEWDADNDGVPDNYFFVVNPARLEEQMNQALARIRDDSGSSAGLASNSFTFLTDTLIFQTRFNSDGWAGELNAYPVTSSSIGAPQWQAQVVLASKAGGERVILTYDVDKTSPKGIPFRWASMTANGSMQTTLNKLADGTVDNHGSDRVLYLRGDADNTMRTRPSITGTSLVNKLGDMVNSQAQYVGPPNLGYGDSSYAAFTVSKRARTKMVYVGANDGMLHGFNAVNGEELLAYVPSEMYRVRGGKQLLSKLTQPDYGKTTNPHRYYVDGTPTMGDICTGSCAAAGDWKTILVGGLAGGGQGIYALNITDPSTFSESNASGTSGIVKWEFLDHDHDGDNSTSTVTGDADLGYTYGRPYVVRLCTQRDTGASPAFPNPKACVQSKWYVMFGNGYNNTESDGYASTSGDAVLYVLDADTGYLVKKIAVNQGNTVNPNGLAEVAPVDIDGDGTVDYVYAGDLKGNLWRFDFTSDNTTNWAVPFGSSSNPVPLYVARDQQATPQTQPITTSPDLIIHPQVGMLVMFGTGSYVDTNDPSTTQVQTMYGIWDNNAAITNGRTDLVQQSVITNTVTAATATDVFGQAVNIQHDYRTISANTVDWTTKKGWYIDLHDSKERVSFDPRVLGGSVLMFNSTVPSLDACDSGGYSWTYFVDAVTGGRLNWSVFTSLQGIQSFGGTSGYASAMKSVVGISPAPTLITGSGGQVTGFFTGSGSGNGGVPPVDRSGFDLGRPGPGRLSWREILGD